MLKGLRIVGRSETLDYRTAEGVALLKTSKPIQRFRFSDENARQHALQLGRYRFVQAREGPIIPANSLLVIARLS